MRVEISPTSVGGERPIRVDNPNGVVDRLAPVTIVAKLQINVAILIGVRGRKLPLIAKISSRMFKPVPIPIGGIPCRQPARLIGSSPHHATVLFLQVGFQGIHSLS